MIDKALYKNKKTKPVKQAGVMNYLGKQEMVTAPKFWLSEPDHVKAKLAYITDEEEQILIDKNLYGSLKGKPNKGPAGLPSLQGGDFGAGGGSGSSGNSGDNNREDRRSDQYGQSRTTAQKGTLSDPEEKRDYFTQSYTGPSKLGGLIGGYQDTVVPNTTAYGNRSKLGSLIVGGFGALAGIPGLGLITNKLAEFGPFNNKQFFDEKVMPAGKFKGVGFQDYMSQRMAGTIDAYGNPISRTGDGGRQNILQTGIMGVQGVIPSETKDPLSKSASLKDLDFNYGTFSNPVMYSDL